MLTCSDISQGLHSGTYTLLPLAKPHRLPFNFFSASYYLKDIVSSGVELERELIAHWQFRVVNEVMSMGSVALYEYELLGFRLKLRRMTRSRLGSLNSLDYTAGKSRYEATTL